MEYWLSTSSGTLAFQHSMRTLSDAHTQEAVDIIRSGGIVAHATETCYGFTCDVTNRDAERKLYAVKQLPYTRHISALFSSIDEAKKWVKWNEKTEELAEKHLPGPLTIVLPLMGVLHASTAFSTGSTPPQVGGTIGMRISSHLIAQLLAA
jgi:L-threonylcarbamoyladenylate synthase